MKRSEKLISVFNYFLLVSTIGLIRKYQPFIWRSELKETFTLNAEGTYKVAIENEIYLGLASGLQNSILKTVERDFFMRKQGYIRNGNKLSPWEIEKLFVNGTELVPAGRWLEGKTLAEAGAEDLISVLLSLSPFSQTLKKRELSLRQSQRTVYTY